ncbi:hypothetical protein CPB86DRAFT_780897 [Serendipita vermifera]|nr:hypothetical protein CPB86DRAFT_780897 [Serendipita vermifera]
MVPAGPFALGPLAAGMSGVSRPSSYIGTSGSGRSGGASNAGKVKPESAVVLPRNRDQLAVDDAPEVYSDDDEFDTGVVDLEEVKLLDAMAPDALKKEKRKDRKQSTKVPRVKKEPLDADADAEMLSKDQAKNESQALDLSESEDEIELEDLRQHFVLGIDGEDEAMLGSDAGQLYLFQFPEDFPDFEAPRNPENNENPPESSTKKRSVSPSKRVSFAEDTKIASTSKESAKEADVKEEEIGGKPSSDNKPSGIIGHLEILQSGAVRMRLGNGHVFDVFAATQPSFLQQAVVLDLTNKKMNVLGNVTRRFVATPDIDALIDSTNATDLTNVKKMELDRRDVE